MATKIFINLPVRDLAASIAFFTRVGFTFNPQFSNESGTCMVISDDICVMLLTEPFFQTFITKPVADPRQATGAIFCISVDSRAEVDRLADAALAAGGQPVPQDPKNEMEFMYDRNFQDLDGHLWNVLYMDPAAAAAPQPAEVSAG